MNLTQLPDNLPVPQDDGAADHLSDLMLSDIALDATDGTSVPLAEIQGRVVLYIYPMTGRPDTPLPANWDDIPGARGCTPQSCGFRDHHAELLALDTAVFGLSSQSTTYQQEAKNRLKLPFELLSDQQLQLADKLRLPVFEAAGQQLYRRMTLIALEGKIQKVFYPVFPPGENAGEVLAWLKHNP